MIAIIIPIYPKHYNHIENLRNKLKSIKNCIDIYLVFSNNDDYDCFKYKDDFKKIIIDKIDPNNIITYKKFYGLKALKDNKKYSHFIVCDSEITIIRKNFNLENIINKVQKIFNNKKIFAGYVNDIKTNNLIKCTTDLFINDNDRNKLKELTLNYKLFYWWSELPVYDASHLDDFFSKIDYTIMVYNHFDHLLYLNYLMLYRNFELFNITPSLNHNWSLECYNTNNNDKLKLLQEYNYSFSWIDPYFYLTNKEFSIENGSFLIYNLDRYHLNRKQRIQLYSA